MKIWAVWLKCSARASPGRKKSLTKNTKSIRVPELERSEMAGALRVFAGPDAEEKANGDQVRDMVSFRVRGASCFGVGRGGP